jgi:aldehyde:ferredoxin oxidoreductase
MKNGYHGKILRVDLSDRRVQVEPLDDSTALNFLGGRGYGGKILFDENPPKVDPFAPDNRLVFFTSPLIGTSTPCCAKSCVVTKSPLSGTILMSLAGGHFASEMKFTGYDGIVITGKAERPVYIVVNNQEVQIKDAHFIWGKDTVETQEILLEILKDKKARIATIGPAGERLIRLASIISGRHAFGRGGIGAVMGSKNLKAVVLRGSQRAKLFDEERFENVVKELRQRLRDAESVKYFTRYGTSGVLTLVNARGIFPTRNYQFGTFEGACKIDGQAREAYVQKHSTCYRCPVGCTVLTVATDEPYKGIGSEGPEYETLWSFGGQCGNDNLSAIIRAEDLCDRYGLDTVSVGNTIGFAMECFEKGLISKKDSDGLDLRFGNHRAMVEMVRKIATREGFGNILSGGTLRASERIGGNSHKFAMQVKGSELSGYDPRGAMGQGLSYATSPRGGDHQKGLILQEVFGAPPPVDRFAVEGKAELVKSAQEEMAFLDSLGVCNFQSRGAPLVPKDFAKAYIYATGAELNEQEVWMAGERIFNLERLFNLREGFSRKDDTLPERFLGEPLQEGPSAGHTVPLGRLLDDYYKTRGWDTKGCPTSDTLQRLGLRMLQNSNSVQANTSFAEKSGDERR